MHGTPANAIGARAVRTGRTATRRRALPARTGTDSTSWSHRRRRFPKLRAVRVEVRLLGRFELVVDGRLIDGSSLSRRDPAQLVKLLALAPTHRMHREQIIDQLWTDAPLAVRRQPAAQGRALRPQGHGSHWEHRDQSGKRSRSSPAQISRPMSRCSIDWPPTRCRRVTPRSSIERWTCIAGELLPLRSL